jgi:hypothetical protein
MINDNHLIGFFEREVTKFYARNCLQWGQYIYRVEIVDRIPRPFQIRLLQEYIGNDNRKTTFFDVGFGSNFHQNIHLALDFLTEKRQRSSRLVDRHDVLLDVCESLIRSKFHYHILGISICRSSDESTKITQSTYFLFAIIMQWFEIQNAMVSASEDLVNKQCRYFGYPMDMAIRLGYTHTVRMLTEAGAEVYRLNDRGYLLNKSMKEAAREGHLEVIEYLLNERFPIPECQMLPIWRQVAEEAAAHGHPHISMIIVVKHGELLGKRSLHMVLCNAAAHGSNELVRKLIEYDTRGMNWPGSNPLRNACGGHLGTCKLLLEACSDNDKCRLNNKAIWVSVARAGRVDILEFLTQHGVLINNKFSILPDAAEFGQLDMAKYAVSQNFHSGGKKSKPRNKMTYSEQSLYFSLFRAIVCKQSEIVRWLIKDMGMHPDGVKGLCIGAELIPLALAIDSGSVKMPKLLVELGATPLPKEHPGEPSTLTARLHRKTVLDQLRVQLNLGKRHSRNYICPPYYPPRGGRWPLWA